MSRNLFNVIPGMDHEEMHFLTGLTRDMTDQEVATFASIYNGKRKSPDTILIGCILGLFPGVAGIQRFMINQIGMGILYLFTAGLCLVGTIVDLINYRKLAFEHNQKQAYEAVQIMKMMG